jgi:membrane peptidoglycan carboxypeptidase
MSTADNLSRKLNELRMAVDIEHTTSKQAILDGYLNDAYFGNGAWGIEAAAETYFGTTAANLNMLESATLAGIVENPSQYDPIAHPAISQERRNTVLARMTQVGVLSKSASTAAQSIPLAVTPSPVQSGCTASRVGIDAFFCDYVIHTILLSKQYGSTTLDRAKLLATGGLRIYTTLAPQDQYAATSAVNFVMPAHSRVYNPAHNADTTVVLQPGTGRILAIAEDRQYGTGKNQTEVDYAVNSPYGGGQGVQTGSSSKLFTLITALKQGIPFGFQMTVPGTTTVNGYYDCHGAPAGTFQGQQGVYNVTNAEGPQSASTQSLYTGTTASVNVFYAELEQKVGLCNVVRTAAALGVNRADGTSLFARDGNQDPADDIPAFTLGAVNVSPMSMAAAYATVASGGVYCRPVALTRVVTASGGSLPVPPAGCHRALTRDVANAVNYILQGVLTTGTASVGSGGPGPLANYQAAGKTGTSNIGTGNGTPYAAFAGYTTNLVSYTSVFNPLYPTTDTMTGLSACYRAEFTSYPACPGEMFGANAPGQTWHMTFDRANLRGAGLFALPSPYSQLWSQGNGQVVRQPPKPKKPKKGHGTGGPTGPPTGPPHP